MAYGTIEFVVRTMDRISGNGTQEITGAIEKEKGSSYRYSYHIRYSEYAQGYRIPYKRTVLAKLGLLHNNLSELSSKNGHSHRSPSSSSRHIFAVVGCGHKNGSGNRSM
jgi:hypothetical protein